MRRSRKSNKKPTRKSNKKSYTFKRSRVPPRRSRIMRGGQASISNSDIAASPQSYLPYNNFSNDPGYSVIDSRNTGAFLTGTFKGGKRRSKGAKNAGHKVVGVRRFAGEISEAKWRESRKSNRRLKKFYGGDDFSASISSGVNALTNGVGVMSSPSFNETSGVAGVISGFSNTGSAYNSTPANIAPIA